VTGVDPAAASIAVARGKPFAERVRWVIGEASAYAGPPVDLITMTGNVAQVFVSDEAWTQTFCACRAALGTGGWIAFETRDPTRRPWVNWTPEHTRRRVVIPTIGAVTVSAS
jgi:hypothetical protein